MLPFTTPLFLQLGMGFSPFHAGLMMIPMILGSLGTKRIVVSIVNRLGYRTTLIVSTLTLKDLPDSIASGGNSLLSMTMQLSMSLGVSLAGILLSIFAQQGMLDIAIQTTA